MIESKPAVKKLNLRWLPGVLISAVAIFAVVRFSNIKDVGSAFRSVKVSFLLLLAGLSVLTLVVRGVAWKSILGNKVKFDTAFFGVCEGYFLNNLLPFRAGELARGLFVGRSSGLGTMHVLSTILIERAFDIVFAASIFLLTLPRVVGASWMKPVGFTAFAVVLIGLLVLFLISKNRERVKTWIEARKFRSSFINTRIVPQVNKLLNGLEALVNPAQFFLSIFWIGMTWVLWVLIYYLAVSQVVNTAPLWWGGFIASLLALGVAIPSAPAAVGVSEASIVGAFSILGISSGIALAYGIVLHVAQIITTSIFGLWGLIRDGQNFSDILASIKLKRQAEEINSDQEL